MAKGSEDSLLAARPGYQAYQPGYLVALSGAELRREGDACEGHGRGGTDCAGHLHTPDCDARDGEGHAHWHACGEGKIHLTPLSPGGRGGATTRSAP